MIRACKFQDFLTWSSADQYIAIGVQNWIGFNSIYFGQNLFIFYPILIFFITHSAQFIFLIPLWNSYWHGKSLLSLQYFNTRPKLYVLSILNTDHIFWQQKCIVAALIMGYFFPFSRFLVKIHSRLNLKFRIEI